MSRTTKKKYVTKEVLNSYELPTNEQSIVKVLKSRGNNLHEVVTAEGNTYLASMPPKFRKHVWIRRGSFVVVDPIEEGDKVKGEIAQVLLENQIKYYKEEGVWPKEFCDETSKNSERKSSDSENNFVNTNHAEDSAETNSESEDSSDDDDLFVNPNRPYVDQSSSDDDSEEEIDK